MSFGEPLAFLLLGGVLLLGALAVWSRQHRLRGRRLALVTVLRVSALCALILALAEPSRDVPPVTSQDPAELMVVADVSSSVDLRDCAAKIPAASRVVVVAGRARFLVDPRPSAEDLAREAADLDPERTDLAAGLRLARSGFRGHGPREVVVLSDRGETQGDGLAEAARLVAQGIRVRWVDVDPSHRGPRILNVEAQHRWVREGEGVRLSLRLASSSPKTVPLTLSRTALPSGDRRTWQRTVTLGPTPQVVEIQDLAGDPGLLDYRLEVGRAQRGLVLPVRGSPRVLVLEGQESEAVGVVRALKEAGLTVEVRPPTRLPGPRELRRWELVTLVNVPLDGERALDAAGQSALRDHVTRGGGLLVLGGDRAYDLGAYRESVLEQVLPVRSERRSGQLPQVALVLLIDRSSSMKGPKLELAKVAARDVHEHLTDRDTFGVVAFNKAAKWSVPPGRGLTTERVRSGIDLHAAGGGTDLRPALELAQGELVALDARVKHLVVLTDGITPHPDDLLARARALAAARITLSTVALGQDADQALLKRLARAGGGRHYEVQRSQSLPRILLEEAQITTGRTQSNEPFRPRVARAGAPLRGVDFSRAPALRGLASTRLAPTATLWLSGRDRPLLAGWDHGSGRVVAWTSDAGLRWAHGWTRWDGFAKLLRQLLRQLVPRASISNLPTTLQVRPRGDELWVEIEGPGQPTDLALVSSDGSSAAPVPLQPEASGRWTARLPRPTKGAHLLRLRAESRIVLEEGLSAPLPALEHTVAPIQPQVLRDVEPRPHVLPQGRWPSNTPFLLLGLVLLVLEVFARRALQVSLR